MLQGAIAELSEVVLSLAPKATIPTNGTGVVARYGDIHHWVVEDDARLKPRQVGAVAELPLTIVAPAPKAAIELDPACGRSTG